MAVPLAHCFSLGPALALPPNDGEVCALGSVINNILIQTLRAQIEVSRLCLSNLSEEISAASNDDERARLRSLFGDTLKQSESLSLELAAMLEQKE
jgi:hypothetical protein